MILKLLKKIFIILIVICALLLLAVWSPWQKWNISPVNLFGISSKEEYSGLKVSSLSGEIDVYLDDEYQGTAVSGEEFFEVFPVDPGEHIVKLSRKAEGAIYADIVRKVNFEAGIDVVVGFDIGPTEDFSEGHILSARKSFAGKEDPVLEIFSVPDNIKVSIDETYVGETPLKNIPLDISNKRKLKFEKAGFDTLEIDILPENQADRDKLKSKVLTLEVNLFTRPVKIVNQ